MLRGRCACKAVGYEVADEFVIACNCHCSNCRAMTGSAFLPWGEIEPEKLRIKKGTDSLLIDGDADAAHAMRCGQCWSLLYWTVHHHDRTWLRVPYGHSPMSQRSSRSRTCSSAQRLGGTRSATTFPSTTSTPGLDRGRAAGVIPEHSYGAAEAAVAPLCVGIRANPTATIEHRAACDKGNLHAAASL